MAGNWALWINNNVVQFRTEDGLQRAIEPKYDDPAPGWSPEGWRAAMDADVTFDLVQAADNGGPWRYRVVSHPPWADGHEVYAWGKRDPVRIIERAPTVTSKGERQEWPSTVDWYEHAKRTEQARAVDWTHRAKRAQPVNAAAPTDRPSIDYCPICAGPHDRKGGTFCPECTRLSHLIDTVLSESHHRTETT
jgi:hypothetical protein